MCLYYLLHKYFDMGPISKFYVESDLVLDELIIVITFLILYSNIAYNTLFLIALNFLKRTYLKKIVFKKMKTVIQTCNRTCK